MIYQRGATYEVVLTGDTYQTLDGRAYKSVDKQWTFTIELLQDWGAASSLFEAMWSDAGWRIVRRKS